MILGRDKPAIIKSNKNPMKIYGKGINNYSNVSQSVKLKPIVSRKKAPGSKGSKGKNGRLGISNVYRLPRLY